jgi:hypothetical protein
MPKLILVKKGNLGSNPALSPDSVILQFTPSNDLRSLGEHRLQFHRFNRVRGLPRFKHRESNQLHTHSIS